MDKKMLIKILAIIALPVLTFIFEPPEGLPPIGWHMFGIYFATILGIVLRPWPLPVVLLTGVASAAVLASWMSGAIMVDKESNLWLGSAGSGEVLENATKIAFKGTDALSGYSNGTAWLVFAAFALSTAFIVTGLGRRLAYHMIGAFGSTTLRLGYMNACLDALLSPAMPSTTARAGGVMFPIMNSVTVALGSYPDKNPRLVGHYLLLNCYMVVKTTGYLFFTAMAPNALALELLGPILHINVSWKMWFYAACVPGFLCLFLTPLVVYFLYPPELKKVDSKTIAKEGLAQLGPITRAEIALLGVFVAAILGWMFSEQLKIGASIVAICAMTLVLLLSIVKWEDIINNKGAWNTFIWYGGIIGLSSLLRKTTFFDWLAELIKTKFSFGGGEHGTVALIGILTVSVAIRYLFASGAAYVAAMVPVFALVGVAAHCDPLLLAFGLLFSNSYGGALTHYGSAPAPVIFGGGYNDLKSWWITGGIFAVMTLLIHITVGFAWWEFLSGQGVFTPSAP